MSSSFTKFLPTLNRVLIKKFEAQLNTKSGIILKSAADKTSVGEVIAVGPGIL